MRWYATCGCGLMSANQCFSLWAVAALSVNLFVLVVLVFSGFYFFVFVFN